MIFPLYIFDFNYDFKPNEIPKNYSIEKIKEDLIPEIQPRDFNLLDKSNNYKISTLIIRKSGYLLKLYNFRCIITSTKAYIFNTENFNITNFITFFNYSFNNSNIISVSLPSELRFLELLLIYVCNQTDITINQLTISVNQVSFENIQSTNLKNILSLQNKLTNAEQEYMEIRNVISELVESKEDMFEMYLSKKSKDLDNIDKDDELKLDEFERLLDNYNCQLNEDINLIKKLIKEVDNKLRLADISLADLRNKIALYNTHISILSISISIGSFIAAIYGMNLQNNIENLTGGLYIISSGIIIISVIVYNLVYYQLDKIKKKIILI
jgi:magnesium transporter